MNNQALRYVYERMNNERQTKENSGSSARATVQEALCFASTVLIGTVTQPFSVARGVKKLKKNCISSYVVRGCYKNSFFFTLCLTLNALLLLLPCVLCVCIK